MKILGTVLAFAAGTVALAQLPLKPIGVVVLALATASAAAFAWRKRQREVTAVVSFLTFSLVAELVLEPLRGAPYDSLSWYTAAGIFLSQAAALVVLALVVLAGLPWKRALAIPAIALGAALALLLVSPKSVRWLYKVADIAAIAGVVLCGVTWWRREAPLSIPVVVTMMVCSCAAAGAVVHAADYQDVTTWNYQAAAMTAALLAATGLHLRGLLNEAS